jgi:hypothetical protein
MPDSLCFIAQAKFWTPKPVSRDIALSAAVASSLLAAG